MSFANLDIYQIADYYAEPIGKIELFLHEYQLMPDNTNLETLISNKILDMFKLFQLTDIANIVLSLSGSIIMGAFITLFFAFFLIKTHIYSTIPLLELRLTSILTKLTG